MSCTCGWTPATTRKMEIMPCMGSVHGKCRIDQAAMEEQNEGAQAV